jgi:hypothetical protein
MVPIHQDFSEPPSEDVSESFSFFLQTRCLKNIFPRKSSWAFVSEKIKSMAQFRPVNEKYLRIREVSVVYVNNTAQMHDFFLYKAIFCA